MGSLILLFAITLSVIMLASYREIREKNAEMLERYADMYTLRQQPDSQNMPEPSTEEQNNPNPEHKRENPPLDKRPDYQLSTFYSVALAADGTVLAVDNGEKNVYEEDELIGIAEELSAKNKQSGKSDHLSYIISEKDGYTLIALMDNTLSESHLNTLVHNILIVGGIAIIFLFFISLHLSKRIIRPLEENDRKQKQFISDASHELKTPVAVIGVNAELLSAEIGENEWLANISYENERMGGLVKQLLDLSGAENEEAPTEHVDLSRVVTGEALALESLAFDWGKTLRSDIDEGILLTGNQSQLTQLVSILLDNAIRHSDGSTIEISLKHRGNAAILNVINEGKEIPPEKREHLFDRFYRLDEARGGEGNHYGLGLSIAKATAEKHGGTIGVSCQNGKICFTVSLPLKK